MRQSFLGHFKHAGVIEVSDHDKQGLIRTETLREDFAQVGGSRCLDGFLCGSSYVIRVIAKEHPRHGARCQERRLRLFLPERILKVALGERHFRFRKRSILQDV